VAIGAAIKAIPSGAPQKLQKGIKDSLAQHTCSEPYAIWRTSMQGIEYPDGDLNCPHRLTKENNPIPTVKNLARHLTGFTWLFGKHRHRSDSQRPTKSLHWRQSRFQGILILLDELNYYLQSWASDSFCRRNGTQNITNICEIFRKNCLLSFTQIHPSSAGNLRNCKATSSYPPDLPQRQHL